jgi:hypothetical protein
MKSRSTRNQSESPPTAGEWMVNGSSFIVRQAGTAVGYLDIGSETTPSVRIHPLSR